MQLGHWESLGMIYTAPWQAPSPSAGKKPKPLCWGCNLNHSQVHSVATSHQGGGSVPSAPGPCLPHSSRAGKDNPGPSGLRKKQQGKKKKEKKMKSFHLINSLNQFSGVQASTRNLSPFGTRQISWTATCDHNPRQPLFARPRVDLFDLFFFFFPTARLLQT